MSARDLAAIAELPLRGGGVTIIDAADLPLVEGLRFYRDRHDDPYAYFTLRRPGQKSKSQSLARFLLDAPAGMEVDHINGVRLDNRRSNLRIVTVSQNQLNRHRLNRNNTSGYHGVCPAQGKWRAEIRLNRKKVYLGYFGTPEAAYAARLAAEALL